MSIHPSVGETDPYLQHLERRGMLKKTGMSFDELARKMIRASGLVICEHCGKDYYHHPYASECRDDQGHPFLHVTCDGDIVKL